jgi:molybdopterin-guanine dinucleotide biosynthesis protein A
LELSSNTTAEVFADVFYSKIDAEGDGRSSERPKPIRTIDWRAQGTALGEHIAGPYCEDTQGYNDNYISAEEMRTCTTIQYLIEKQWQWPQEWRPDPDDEAFQSEGYYFFSGLGDRVGTWEDDVVCTPERHDIGTLDPAFGNRRGFTSGDMLFHPCCLEIFRRVSERRTGAIDINGLAEWWDRPQEGPIRPMHAAVQRGRGEWWQHYAGDEFLAASPLEIPTLTALSKAASRPQESFNARSSTFAACSTTLVHESDLFGRLPEELRSTVLSQLTSKDIANLRLASRTFRHLPVTLWHDLMMKKWPWIWEAWSDRPYPALACTTRNELEAINEVLSSRIHALERLQGDQQAAIVEARSEHKKSYDALLKPHPVHQLHRLRTDWYWLYCQINREWINIKGLQNRERIWKTLEFVIRRIDSPEEDVQVVVEEHSRSFPFRFERLKVV